LFGIGELGKNPAEINNNPDNSLILPKQSELQLAPTPSQTLNPNKKGKLFYKRKAHLPI
jgi:hypothetical protein